MYIDFTCKLQLNLEIEKCFFWFIKSYSMSQATLLCSVSSQSILSSLLSMFLF